MDDEALAAVHERSHREFFRLVGTWGSPGSSWREWPGVGAALIPATPERSLPNSVLYEDAGSLLEHHQAIADAFAGAGVKAFTIWVPPEDEQALAPELERLGHVRDSEPMLQAAVLAELPLERLAGAPLELDPEPTARTLGRLNDTAWGMAPGGLSDCMTELDSAPGDALLVRVALHDGEPVSGLVVLLCEADAYVSFVATLPQARGRGLARRLLAHTLLEAAERGALTTTLEASGPGAPVYERMGYRSLWRLAMYERREPA